MNTTWTIGDQQLTLLRFPPNQHDKSLQAWDSADELAISTILERDYGASPSPNVLIIDDVFGALSTGLSAFNPTCLVDSYVSMQAITQNCELNQVPRPELIWSLEQLPKVDLVVLKLSKNNAYIEHHLKAISQQIPDAEVIALGKTTLVTSSILRLFEKYLTNVTTSLAKKKSRLIFADSSPSKISSDSSIATERIDSSTVDTNLKPPFQVAWPDKNISLHAHANVFSKDSLDIGGRFLADNLNQTRNLQADFTVIDLGCGNGLLGLSWLALHPSFSGKLIFSDDSYMAVKSAEYNVTTNFPERLSMCSFRVDDCLTQQPANSADLILCNPPFHQQNAITTHIAEQMIGHAHSALKVGGELLLVANRHLPYQQMLKSAFGGFKVTASNSKFTIYQCTKIKEPT